MVDQPGSPELPWLTADSGQQQSHQSAQPSLPGQSPPASGQPPTPGQHQSSSPHKSTGKRGPESATAALSILLLLAVVAAAVTGGVLGKSLRGCQGALPTSSGNQSTGGQNSTGGQCGTAANGGIAVPLGENVTVGLDCAGVEPERVVTFPNRAWTYNVRCGRDIYGYDISVTVAYRLEDCLMACASLEHYLGKGRCTAATFRADLGKWVPYGGNCFLKNATATATSALSGGNWSVLAVQKIG